MLVKLSENFPGRSDIERAKDNTHDKQSTLSAKTTHQSKIHIFSKKVQAKEKNQFIEPLSKAFRAKRALTERGDR